MAKMIHDSDVDIAPILTRKVAVIGYGSQGHAHALNLKDSGVEVMVGLRPDSSSVDKAKSDGLHVESIADAAARRQDRPGLIPRPVHCSNSVGIRR